MKRLALRISGGIALVVLAILAVGQAQRGGPAAAEATQASQLAQAHQTPASSDGLPTPETPRPFTPAGRVNPLRPAQGALEAKPAGPAVHTAAASESRSGSPTEAEKPPHSAEVPQLVPTADAARPIDPFAGPPRSATPPLFAPAKEKENTPAAIAGAGPSVPNATPVSSPTPELAAAAPSATDASRTGAAGDAHARAAPPMAAGPANANAQLVQGVVPPWTVPLAGGAAAGQAAAPAGRAGSGSGHLTGEARHPAGHTGGGSPDGDEPGLFRPDAATPGKAISQVPPPASPADAAPSTRSDRRAPAAIPPNMPEPRRSPPGGPDPLRPQPDTDAEGSGVPGARELEGPQAPQVVVQKVAPPEVQVGKPAAFEIRLKNTSQVPAHNVEVRDEIPKGTRLLDTQPKASRGVRGELVWSLGTLKPNEEVRLQIQLMPTDEGVLGSKATVTFGAEASARTVSTKPMLALKTVAPPRVLIGDEVTLQITVSNPGTGVAQQVVLEERVPPGLQHPAGSDLVYEVGSLKPGESRQLELKLIAAQAGVVANVLTARADANLKVQDRVELEVLAPQLDIALEGPRRRYLEREATYTVSISNPGTAPARQVELIAQLPPGLKFVSANNAGHYQQATHTVHWTLEELPSKETGSVQLTTVPVEPGQQLLRLRSTADKGLSVEKEMPLIIEGIASPSFQVTDTADPVEVGGETTYQIRVFNQGSKAASNVQLSVVLPPELRLVAAEPTVRQSADPGRIVFDPLQHLAPKAETIYRIRVQAIKPGNHRVRAQLAADEMEPVTKEESTRVYSDE